MTEARMDERDMLRLLRDLHARIRASVLAACAGTSSEALSRVAADDDGDTIFAIDRVSEDELVRHLEAAALPAPVILVAEGLPAAGLVLPRGSRREDAAWRIIVDPIDGTRGLMYQKRSAWILSGAAPVGAGEGRLSEISVAIQTEIPLLKQNLADQLWCIRGGEEGAERIDVHRDEARPIEVRPSRARSLDQGFATIVRFFPGERDLLGEIDEELTRRVLGPPRARKAASFEDQYACSGGQLHALASGQDRFVADLRPLVDAARRRRGEPPVLCCHPYDLCSLLVAERRGVIVTDARGRPLDAPLDLEADVAWIGYANEEIRRRVEPALLAILEERGLLEGTP
ncbi:MAG: inositol monophosphatase [Planctomycetota bacterium]